MAAPWPAQLSISRFTFAQVSGIGQRGGTTDIGEKSKQRKKRGGGERDRYGGMGEGEGKRAVVLNIKSVFAFIPETPVSPAHFLAPME